MSQISQPLKLRSQLRETDLRLETIPFIDIGLIALCFLLMDSPFITTPGISLDLVQSTNLKAAHAVTVLTVKHNDLLIYNGSVITLSEFRKITEAEEGSHRDKMLLVKPSKDVSLQSLIDICDAARQAGFKQVQIAAEPK